MALEIRPVTRAEAVEYLRVLPFANGLPGWEPAPAAWHAGAGAWPPPPAPASPRELERYADEVVSEGFRSQAAFVDGRIVGGSALLSLRLTLPGLRQVPLGGVTSTGVLATHRRRGLLRAMMVAMFADARDHGECLLGLSASEGGIYGRFGFSPATLRARWELERSEAQFSEPPATGGELELVDAAVAREAWPAVHEQARRGRVGEVSARSDHWAGLSDEPNGTDGPLRFVVHRNTDGRVDGVVNYRLPWSADASLAGALVVEAFEATSLTAYSALWRMLSDFDLTRRVVAAGRPVDEPLRWMLRNPRALRVTRLSDNLWIRILDVGEALQARSYGVEGQLTLEVTGDLMCPQNNGHWRLEASGGDGLCARTETARSDLTMDINALGSLYLGGISPGNLAAAGRIAEHRAGALTLLANLLATDPPPFNAVGF